MRSHELLLQPVSAGDLIDRALRLYRRHLAPLLATAAAPGLVAVVGGLLTALAGSDLMLAAAGNFLTYSLSPILNLMVIGGLTKVVADHVMRQEPISMRRTWQIIFRHLGRLLGVAMLGWLLLPVSLMILGGVGFVGVGILAFLLVTAAPGQTESWLMALPITTVAVSLVLVGGFFFLEIYGRVVMMPAAAIMERQPVGSAISRGLRLGARNSPKVLAVLAFEFCLMWSIATALGVPVGVYLMASGIATDANATEVLAVSFNILLQFGNLLAAPVAAVAFALLYFDNRVRKEGLDVEFLAREITSPATPPAVAEIPGASEVVT